MADPLGRAVAGTPFRPSASAWNRMLDASRAFDAGAGNPSGLDVPHCLVRVRNDTGGDLAAFSVLALGASILDITVPLRVSPTPMFEGTTPAATSDAFAILIEPALDGKFALAAIAGVVPVEVNVTDAAHEYATPTAASSARLTSAASGPARILDATGTGNVPAAVLLEGTPGGGDPTAYGQQGGPATATPSFSTLSLISVANAGGTSGGSAGEIEEAGVYLVIVQMSANFNMGWIGSATPTPGYYGALFTANLNLLASGTSTVVNLSQRQAGAIGTADEGQALGWAGTLVDTSITSIYLPGAGSATLMGLINCTGGSGNKVAVSVSVIATNFQTTGGTAPSGTPNPTAFGPRPAAAFVRLGNAQRRSDPTVTGAWSAFP